MLEEKSDHSKPSEFLIELKTQEKCHKIEKLHHDTSDTIFFLITRIIKIERLKGKCVSLLCPVPPICTFDSKFVFTTFP